LTRDLSGSSVETNGRQGYGGRFRRVTVIETLREIRSKMRENFLY
jgi:hypothetical protein